MSIPTLKAVLLPHHVKEDGSCNIKIRLTHNRKTKYIATTEFARKGDYTKDLTIKSNTLIKRLSTLIDDMQNVISEIGTFPVKAMTVEQLAKAIESKMSNEEFQLDFFEWAAEFIKKKEVDVYSSSKNYATAIRSFQKFLKKETMDIREITSSLMRRYEEHLAEKHGKDARAVSQYTACISTIHGAARRKYNDNELGEVLIRNPFEFYKPPKQKPTQKRTIEKEVIQKLIDIRKNLGELHKKAVDIYLLSFCLMGTNMPDLYEATKVGDTIYYNRKKTRTRRYDKAEMQIRLETICKDLIEEMIDPSGKRAFFLHNQFEHYQSAGQYVNEKLKEVATLMGVKPFTMYSARHTWASIAYSIGINKSLINDCLCHVDPDMEVTDIYIKKDWSVLWEANKKVIEQFNWK